MAGHEPFVVGAETVPGEHASMLTLIAQYGVVVVAAVIFFGELGFPTLVPGEIALVIAGSQMIHSMPRLLLAVVGFGIVDIIATSTIHTASRTGGHRLLMRLLRHVMRGSTRHEDALERWRLRLGGRMAAAVFVTRMIPMFRLYASITSGLIRIPMRSFLLGAAPASLLWASIPLTLGYVLRQRIHAMEGQYALMMHLVIAVSVVAAVLAGGTLLFRRASLSAERLRRARILLGMTVIAAATSRLGLAAADGGVGRPALPIPPMPTSFIWTCSFTALTLGLLWLVAHDVRGIRSLHGRTRAAGAARTVAWVGMIVLVTVFGSAVGVQPHAA